MFTFKYYIGSTNHFVNRWNQHIRELNLNIHGNGRLQNSWNKYYGDNFIFYVLEEVNDFSKLVEREQYYLNLYKAFDRKFGYNINIIADRPIGLKMSEEAKRKLSECLKGRVFTEEHKNNIKLAVNNSEKNYKNKPNKEKWPHTKRCKCEGCKLIQIFDRRDFNFSKKILKQYSIEAI